MLQRSTGQKLHKQWSTLYNRTPHAGQGFVTPFQKRFGVIPDLSSIPNMGVYCVLQGSQYQEAGPKVQKVHPLKLWREPIQVVRS